MPHTPGPWTVQKFTDEPVSIIIGQAGDERICEMHSNELATTVTANATLLAAAPELLEALHYIRFRVAEMETDNHRPIEFSEVRALWDTADAAIARAEGRTTC
jgi:hypothetical protein